jgi:DNA-binding GntR family transcriptional regulator
MTDLSKRFQPRKFGDEAADVIRQLILSGELPSGERLNEVALAQRLGISRSPIREALNALAGEGLINFTPGKGAFVPEFDVDTVRQLGEARRALECEAVRLAVAHVSEAVLDEIVAVLEKTSLSVRGEGEPHSHVPDFHALIISNCGNQVIEQMASSVNRQLRLARSVSFAQNPARVRAAVEEHIRIAEAIRRRDAVAAAAAMHDHLSQAILSTQAAMSATSSLDVRRLSTGTGR